MILFSHFNSPDVAKRYELVDGQAVKKPAATFKTGPYETASVASMKELGGFIDKLKPGNFITSGVNQTQPSGQCGLGMSDIHRTKQVFPFALREPGVLIIDSDGLLKLGIETLQQYEVVIEQLIGKADYVTSPSASSGIYVNGAGGELKGIHTFCFIEDASSIPDALLVLHKRSVLLGYGYPLVTKAGVVLIRSLVDLAMKAPNQPCYEGGAILADGITQERKLYYTQTGDEPNFLKVEPLTPGEEAEFEIKEKKLKKSVADEAAEVRNAWCEARGNTLLANGCAPDKVKRILDAALSGDRPVLSGDFEIHTDNFGIKTVRELLFERTKYHEATCADPLDPDDGVGKAKIYTLNSRSQAIYSFAHGGCSYILEEDLFRDLTENDIHPNAPDTLARNTESSLSDVANGERYAEHFREQLLFVRDTPQVLVFDQNMGWKAAPSTYPMQAAKIVVQAMREKAAEAFSKELSNAKAMLTEVTRTSKEHNMRAMISMAKSEDSMSIGLGEIDSNPYLLGVYNGVVDLKTQSLIPPTPNVFVTKRANVSFNADADCPLFCLFLSQVLPDKTEREFLIRFLGYTLSGLVTEQYFLFLLGKGSNGKSVLVEIIYFLLGDYAQKIQTEMLMKQYRSTQSASPDLVSLQGRRLIYCNETSDGQRLDDARVKEMTGGDTITGRLPYATQAVSFTPTHKLMMVGNHAPIIQDDSYGMWRRIKLIPFTKQFKESDPGFDPQLLDKLKRESSGILNLLLRGFSEFQKAGMQTPTSLEDATNVYRNEQDLLEQWINENCTISPTVSDTKERLHSDYKSWCDTCGVVALSRQRFSRKLTDKGYVMKPDKRTVTGIEIKPWQTSPQQLKDAEVNDGDPEFECLEMLNSVACAHTAKCAE